MHAIYTYPFAQRSGPRGDWCDAARGTLAACVDGDLAEVERVQHDGVLTAELDRRKRNLESEFIYQRETVQGQASQLGYFGAILADLAYEARYLKAIARTTPQDIQRVARTYLRPTNLTVGFFVPHADGVHVTRERIAQTVQGRIQPSRRRRPSRTTAARHTQIPLGQRYDAAGARESCCPLSCDAGRVSRRFVGGR